MRGTHTKSAVFVLTAALLSLMQSCGCATKATEESSSPHAPSAPSEVSEIAPYLLDLQATRAVICWVTREPSLSRVLLHGYDSSAVHGEGSVLTSFHRVVLDGLVAGSRYRYQIGGVHSGTFATAELSGPLRVAVFGHTGGTGVPREYPTDLLAGRLESLRPDVTLCTGDIAYHSNFEGFREAFFRPFARFLAERPIYLAPSNHDCDWPWLHGRDYSEVRRLFPHEYSAEAGAYYQFAHRHVRFFAVSYVMSEVGFREQVAWLEEALQASDAEFNVVFLGGQAKPYYDKDYFFRRMSESRVDLVLGGDGGGVFQEVNHGVPFFFAGDGGKDAHPFYWLEFDRYRFKVRVLDSEGGLRRNVWQFHSTREKAVAKSLAKCRQPRSPHVIEFQDIAMASDTFDGLSLQLAWPYAKEAMLQVQWKPASDTPLGGEGAYRARYLRIAPESDLEYRIALPSRDPATGEVYDLDRLNVRLVPYTIDYKKYPIDAGVSSVHLFRDLSR